MKRLSHNSIIIGSISGSIPPTVGYCSVINKIDEISCILFLIFIFWQISHSYSILIFRYKDYEKTIIPTLVKKIGFIKTKKYISNCIFIYIILTSILKIIGYTGYIYLIITTIINIFWLKTSLKKITKTKEKEWAKKNFILSIISIMLFNFMISIDFKK